MPTLERAGIAVAVVLAQRCERIAEALVRREVRYPFPILCDDSRAASKRWGVWHPIGLDAFNTAHPASFLLDPDGRVRYAFVGSTQFARAPIARILEAAHP